MTSRRLLVTVLLLFASLWTTESVAQGLRSKLSTTLSTVTQLHLETGQLGDHAKQCGLTTGDLENPARIALEASRLSLIQSATNFVFVNANVVTAGDVCAAAIDVELFRLSNDFGASVSVWARKALIVGGEDGFNALVRQKVDGLTKEFIADWQNARR